MFFVLRSSFLLAIAAIGASGQPYIDFRIAGAFFRDEAGIEIQDESVLFQLVYLGPNGVFDPIPSGQWVGGDDVLVDLPFLGDYDSAAATDIDATGTFSDGIFSRRYRLPVTAGVAQPGGAFGLRWFPDLSPGKYPGSVPLAGDVYGEISDSLSDMPWFFPAAGSLTAEFSVFDPVAANQFSQTVTEGFSGLSDQEVEPGTWLERKLRTNDTRLDDQTSLLGLGAEVAWNQAEDRFVPIVAVIDSGVDLAHADLASSIWTNALEVDGNGFDDDGNGYVDDVNGWDFLDADNDPDDLTGHGTHLAGIIAAVRDNEFGVAGIARGAKILPLKVGNASYSEPAVIEALDYIVALKNRGVPIVAVNNSYVFISSTEPSVETPLKLAVERVCEAGILFVSSAGNQTRDLDLDGSLEQMDYIYPANYDFDQLIVVGGTAADGDLFAQSNFGDAVDIFAPAESVLSVDAGGGFVRRSGTSQAAAFVSGAIALFSEAAGHTQASRIRRALEATVETNPALSGFFRGRGILSLRRLSYYVDVDLWMMNNYGPNYPENPASDLLADLDGNGLSNLIEFAFGEDAGTSPQGIELAQVAGQPELRLELNPSIRAFDYSLQYRNDLYSGQWLNVPDNEILFFGRTDDDQRVRLQHIISGSDDIPNRFFRLHVESALP